MNINDLPTWNDIVGVRLYVDDTLRCTYYFDRTYDPITFNIELEIDEDPKLHKYRLEHIKRGEI